eukprot:gene8892-biopygen7655
MLRVRGGCGGTSPRRSWGNSKESKKHWDDVYKKLAGSAAIFMTLLTVSFGECGAGGAGGACGARGAREAPRAQNGTGQAGAGLPGTTFDRVWPGCSCGAGQGTGGKAPSYRPPLLETRNPPLPPPPPPQFVKCVEPRGRGEKNLLPPVRKGPRTGNKPRPDAGRMHEGSFLPGDLALMPREGVHRTAEGGGPQPDQHLSPGGTKINRPDTDRATQAHWSPTQPAHWEERLCPRPVRVRFFDFYRAPCVRPASGPRPLPFLPGGQPGWIPGTVHLNSVNGLLDKDLWPLCWRMVAQTTTILRAAGPRCARPTPCWCGRKSR